MFASVFIYVGFTQMTCLPLCYKEEQTAYDEKEKENENMIKNTGIQTMMVTYDDICHVTKLCLQIKEKLFTSFFPLVTGG